MEVFWRSLKNNVFTVTKQIETAGPGHTKWPSVDWIHVAKTLVCSSSRYLYGLVRLLGLVVAHLTSIHRRVVDASRTIRVHAPAVHTIS